MHMYMYGVCVCPIHVHIDACCVFLWCNSHWISYSVHSTGEGGKVREHKTSFHAIARVVRNEGVLGFYNGYVFFFHLCLCSVTVIASVSAVFTFFYYSSLFLPFLTLHSSVPMTDLCLLLCFSTPTYACRLSAGLLRQATYSTTRLGVYQSLFDYFSGWDSWTNSAYIVQYILEGKCGTTCMYMYVRWWRD